MQLSSLTSSDIKLIILIKNKNKINRKIEYKELFTFHHANLTVNFEQNIKYLNDELDR